LNNTPISANSASENDIGMKSSVIFTWKKFPSDLYSLYHGNWQWWQWVVDVFD